MDTKVNQDDIYITLQIKDIENSRMKIQLIVY